MVFCTYLAGIEKKRILMFLEEDSMLKSELKSKTTLRRPSDAKSNAWASKASFSPVVWHFSEWIRPGTSKTASQTTGQTSGRLTQCLAPFFSVCRKRTGQESSKEASQTTGQTLGRLRPFSSVFLRRQKQCQTPVASKTSSQTPRQTTITQN